MKRDPFEDLITQAEAARLRGVTQVAIADLIRRGRLRAVEVAGRKHLRRGDILNFAQRQAGRPRSSQAGAGKRKG